MRTVSPVVSIDPSQLAEALEQELKLYHRDVVEAVNAAGEAAAKKLVKLTKQSAPADSGGFAKAITYTSKASTASGDKRFIWGAKAPKYRITHLLVKGHATVNGGRVAGNPFLQNALDTVLPEYERDVEEAVK